jgi:hypothetical protein
MRFSSDLLFHRAFPMCRGPVDSPEKAETEAVSTAKLLLSIQVDRPDGPDSELSGERAMDSTKTTKWDFRTTPRGFGALVGALLVAVATGCASTPPNRDPVGEVFPSVRGESLAGEDYRLPEDFAGRKILLLVGYVMNSQFDIDRWLLGLLQAEVDVPFIEVPTIDGLLPGMFAGQIDSGMRKGIPREDWPAVITVYGDADEIVRFTGKENPRNARVLLLDEDGKVIWFHDRGYSARLILEIEELISENRR